jgi:RNA polymerase sporulation-specific sigma factor
MSARHVPRDGEAILVQRHRGIAFHVAKEFFIVGADRDDVEQEAMIGLLVGIREWDEQRGPLTPHLLFAVRHWLISAVTAATREKHKILQGAARAGEDDYAVIELQPDPRSQDELDARESLRCIVSALTSLSDLEREALALAANGQTYKTRDGLGPDSKRIDNALQRARLKLQRAAA